jgi:preprotein translocase subunit SecE
MDTVKLAAAALLLLAGVGGFYYFGEQSTLLRVVGLLAVAGVAVALAYTTVMGRTFAGFLGDARTEVRKVVWPTRQETVQTTLIVFVMVILVAIFLWLLDMLLLWGVQALTGQGG